MMKRKQKELKGLKIRNFNTFMIFISCALYACLLMATVYASRNYEQLTDTTNDYIRLEDAAKDIMQASDYLTEQVRLYAETMDPEHAKLYFEEANVTCRREHALEILTQHSLDHLHEESLELAVQNSNALMIREIYAMKLVATAQGHTGTDLPAEVKLVNLDTADLALSREQMLDKARSMLFDEEYQATKNIIYGHLDQFTEGILFATESRMVGGLADLLNAIRTQRVLMSILIALNVITFFVFTLLVVRPLNVFLQCVQERSLFSSTGAYEFKYLAKVYNEIYERSDSLAASEARFRKKAECDALTGILNRYMFHETRKLLSESAIPLALVLIDVDKFKDINDTYGHAGGDQVLIRVAQTIKENLRGSDYVFRVGGDEFAAILPEITAEQADTIKNKLLHINEILQQPTENAAGVSLSIGMALSERGYHEKLYEQADRALYWIKEHGRNGCALYDLSMETEE